MKCKGLLLVRIFTLTSLVRAKQELGAMSRNGYLRNGASP